MKKVALHNLGCKVNAYEIEAMQQLLEENGYTIVPFEEKADIYIVNTCTVTNMADRKSRQMLHRAKKRNPDAVIVAAGCYVQEKGNQADGCIDIIVGNNKKKDIAAILGQYEREKKEEVLTSTMHMSMKNFLWRTLLNIHGLILRYRTDATSSVLTVSFLLQGEESAAEARKMSWVR